METEEIVRYSLLAISIRCYNFNKTSNIAKKVIIFTLHLHFYQCYTMEFKFI